MTFNSLLNVVGFGLWRLSTGVRPEIYEKGNTLDRKAAVFPLSLKIALQPPLMSVRSDESLNTRQNSQAVESAAYPGLCMLSTTQNINVLNYTMVSSCKSRPSFFA